MSKKNPRPLCTEYKFQKTKYVNSLDKQYQELLFSIINYGVDKSDRTGTGTRSIFGYTIRHNMKEGFPLITTKKMYWKGIVTELLWFLRGDTNIKYLVDNNCHIWNGDAYKNYRSKSKDIDLPENLYNKLIDDLNKDAMFPIDNPSRMLSQEGFINKIKTDAEFAKKWGDLGPIYGKQWRKWNKIRFRDINRINQHHNQISGIENPFEEEGKWVRGYEDQIANLINDLKTNPDSRRLMVSAWNVGELDQMTLPPCHYGFQVYTRELSFEERKGLVKPIPNLFTHEDCDAINLPKRAISLMWNQRSVDTFLGLPFNIASYGLLLEIIAKEVNMVPDQLIGNLGDVHIYNNHFDQVREQIIREHYELPRLIIDQFDESNHYIGDIDDVSEYNIEQFKLEGYQSHPAIKAPLSN